MCEFSAVDGFVEIADGLADMIKFVANEPSVGLFYIQQHAHSAVPNLASLKTKVVDRSREMTLHTEDFEDSIIMARSMKECGFRIAEEMVKDIRHSLAVMASRKEKIKMGRMASWGGTFGPPRDVDRSGHFLNVFRSAREKASGIKWPQLESREFKLVRGVEPSLSFKTQTLLAGDGDDDGDSDDLPVSSQVADEEHGPELDCDHRILHLSKSHEEVDLEARLEDWLEGRVHQNDA